MKGIFVSDCEINHILPGKEPSDYLSQAVALATHCSVQKFMKGVAAETTHPSTAKARTASSPHLQTWSRPCCLDEGTDRCYAETCRREDTLALTAFPCQANSPLLTVVAKRCLKVTVDSQNILYMNFSFKFFGHQLCYIYNLILGYLHENFTDSVTYYTT